MWLLLLLMLVLVLVLMLVLVLVLVLGHRRGLSLLLKLHGDLRFNLCPWAAGHSGLRMVRGMLSWMLSHVVLRCRVRHHHVGLRRHGLLWVVRMLGVWRR